MPKPLVVVLGADLPKSRQDAIAAVTASGCTDDNSIEFWDRVKRVQDICSGYNAEPGAVAKALAVVAPHMSCDGKYGLMCITDTGIDRLVRDLASVHR